jgi:hypothetical protein
VSHLDAVVPGLVLRVSDTGDKIWYVVRWFGGKAIRYRIGPYPGIKLTTARDLARDALKFMAEGKDPREERRKKLAEAAGENAFSKIAEQFLKGSAAVRDEAHH